MRESCKELFLTFFCSFKNMSSRGETSNREGGGGVIPHVAGYATIV